MKMEWSDASRARAQAHSPRRAPSTAPACPARHHHHRHQRRRMQQVGRKGLEGCLIAGSGYAPLVPGIPRPGSVMRDPVTAIPLLTMIPAEPVLLAIIGAGNGWGKG